MDLGLVLWVSFSVPIVASFYYLLGATPPTAPIQKQYRVLLALLHELTSLAVLWYVISRRERKWSYLGCGLELGDLPRTLALLIATYMVKFVVWTSFGGVYFNFAGRALEPKSLASAFGYGISWFSIAFVFINPIFEELIVRAYTISEVVNLGGSRTLAVIISVAVQMSYHLYQGLARAAPNLCIHGFFHLLRPHTKNRAGHFGPLLVRPAVSTRGKVLAT